MTDIASRMRQTRASMLGTDDEQHYSDCHEAADTIEALRAENARLRLALRGVLSGVNGATSAPTDVQMISVGALELDDEDD